ncbi:MAG: hypothetical protein IRZ14_08645 [Chloroflexi bacterium]|nr:hypothetical protein [Chloroflexota bacterium]
MWQVVALGGLVFGGLGGTMAFLIVYEEYRHHFPPRAARQHAVQAAGVTVLFFLLLSLAIGAALSVLARGV